MRLRVLCIRPLPPFSWQIPIPDRFSDIAGCTLITTCYNLNQNSIAPQILEQHCAKRRTVNAPIPTSTLWTTTANALQYAVRAIRKTGPGIEAANGSNGDPVAQIRTVRLNAGTGTGCLQQPNPAPALFTVHTGTGPCNGTSTGNCPSTPFGYLIGSDFGNSRMF